MNQKKHDVFLTTGFPIRNSPDQSLFGSSPKLIAAFHVLHQLLVPRHPPCTLSSLITQISNCSYTVLKLLLLPKNNYCLLFHIFTKKLMEMSGIEPLTSALQGPRSPSWATPPDKFINSLYYQINLRMVGLSGFEPLTFPLSGERSKPTEL